MIRTIPQRQPRLSAAPARTGKAMKVILHIGAHRCATTTFQDYLCRNAVALRAQGIATWGPDRLRNGLLRGVIPGSQPTFRRDLSARAIGRVHLNLRRCAGQGPNWLIVSDPDLPGTLRANLVSGLLYPAAGERMARIGRTFGSSVTDVILNVRSQDRYWASAMSDLTVRGRCLPPQGGLNEFATSGRTWRDVITDVACAMPDARILVLPFEGVAGRPEAQLRAATGLSGPMAHARRRLNAAPHLPALRAGLSPRTAALLPGGEGRWQPFDLAQAAALREAYADDLMWLRAGADGLARLVTDFEQTRPGMNPAYIDKTRGTPNGRNVEEGRMA